MAQGIIRVTPKSPGTLEVTVLDKPNPYRISIGQMMNFEKPAFPVALNDVVEFTPLSGTAASVTKVAIPVANE